MFPSNKLYNIQKEYFQLLGQIEEAEGEITPEIDTALQFTEQKLQAEGCEVGLLIKSIDYWEEIVEAEIKRLEGIRTKAIKGKELLKNRLSEAMKQFGIERISTPTITISFRKSEAVEINEETIVPPAFFDQPPPKVSKSRIKEAIKAGQDVPGASIVVRNHLQIK